MAVNNTYRGYRIQILLGDEEVPQHNRRAGPWLPEVQIFGKENDAQKIGGFRMDHSFKRENEAIHAGIRAGKLWVDQKEAGIIVVR